jgi:hypothetical protein
VLAVVQDEQDLAVAYALGHALRFPDQVGGKPKRARDRTRDARGVRDNSEFGENDVAAMGGATTRELEREPRLSRSRRPDERNEAVGDDGAP